MTRNLVSPLTSAVEFPVSNLICIWSSDVMADTRGLPLMKPAYPNVWPGACLSKPCSSAAAAISRKVWSNGGSLRAERVRPTH